MSAAWRGTGNAFISYLGRKINAAKVRRAAGRIAAVGALAAACLGFAQAALAETVLAGTAQAAVSVPCSAADAASAISGASSGETLNLAKFCVYKLTEELPDVDTDLTINGNQSTIGRSYASGTDDFTILENESDLVLKATFRNGDPSRTMPVPSTTTKISP